ncbi:MAG TPA: zinc ribbon domain-containing protein [Clostridia bacterium]|nr:zinc ribbon domain-containing protein [Clostridia bacterium]
MFCSTCGKEIHDEAVICVNCGCAVKQEFKQTSKENVLDIPSGGMNALGFFLPVVGLVLYLVWNDKTPKKAKAIGKWSLIGVVVGVICYALVSCLAGGYSGGYYY